MGYTQEYKKDMETYTELLKKYETVTKTQQYRDIYEKMPFEFLNAKQIAETLELYKDIGKKSIFKFKRADEAIVFYQEICDLKRNMETLLENASYIVEAAKIAEEINEVVEESVYLQNTLKVNTSSRIDEMAKDCITLLPNYPNLMTKSFLYTFIENCLETLNKEGLDKIVEANILKAHYLNEIRLTGSEIYKENIAYLQKKFQLPDLLSEHHLLRLKGTTFKNEDGVDRQDIFKELEQAKENESIILECIPTIFTPEIGNPENAIEVHWKGQCIGYIPKDVVKEMYEKYENPQFVATLKHILGGKDIIYGCEIDFGVIAKEYHKTKEQLEKE